MNENVIISLWNNPGQSWEQILENVPGSTHESIRDLISSGRVSVTRFTTYAPFLNTKFFLFPTEVGRIEVVNHQTGLLEYTYDPMGKWDEKMDEALDNA